MKKFTGVLTILVLSILLNFILIGWIVAITPRTYELDYAWNEIKKDNDINSAYAFHLYIGSDKQKELLEEHEFLMGDRVDYCNIVMLQKKPEGLNVEPEKIEIVSPSGIVHSENFRQNSNENSFTAGHLSKYGERAIAIFNESGLWSIRIEFEHEGTPIGFLYPELYSYGFNDDSRISVFNSDININVYTTSEYAQLWSARASESSAFWSKISTIAIIAAAVIAVSTLGYYLWSFKRQREISYAQQNRIEIYEPLYNEITDISKKLSKFECPFNASSTLKVWKNLKPSVKIRMPKSVEDEIITFDELGRAYYNLYNKSRTIMKGKINSVIDGYAISGAPAGIHNDETRTIRDNVGLKKQQLLEQYLGDFFAGKLSSKKGKPALKELRSYLKYNKKYTEEHIFNRILSYIENNQTVLDLRDKHTELIQYSKNFEKSLKKKINDILDNYESKLEDI